MVSFTWDEIIVFDVKKAFHISNQEQRALLCHWPLQTGKFAPNLVITGIVQIFCVVSLKYVDFNLQEIHV